MFFIVLHGSMLVNFVLMLVVDQRNHLLLFLVARPTSSPVALGGAYICFVEAKLLMQNVVPSTNVVSQPVEKHSSSTCVQC